MSRIDTKAYGYPPTRDLRNLLRAAFTPDDLYHFCEKHPLFRPCLGSFGADRCLEDMIQNVLIFAEHKLYWEELLDGVAAHAPHEYNRTASRLGWPLVEEPPEPVPALGPKPRPGGEMQRPGDSIHDMVDYYSDYDEQGRLASSWGQVEFFRSQIIIRQYLKRPPAVVLDVGGAAGRYACWLAREGYQVHLVDPVPLHIEQAQAASATQPRTPIASCRLGDARRLAFDDESADVVLLMGPLYHLVGEHDRHQALVEACRVLKSGGCLFAVGISRFASTIDGLMQGFFLDPAFRQIMRRDLQDGQHRNPTQKRGYFTDSFFHHPEELKAEVVGAGFELQALLAVEGISYMMKEWDEHWATKSHREFLLELIAKTEQEASLMGASPHMMCVAAKP